jgi:phage shock protein E
MFNLFFRNKYKEALRKGAIIIDVRPAYAFDQNGRIPDSINIPVDRIPISIERIRSMKAPVILCCAYGTDCNKAEKLLKENGIKDVYNAGKWQSLLNVVNSL